MDGLRRAALCIALGAAAGAAFAFGPDTLQLAFLVPFIIAPGRGGVSIATAVACAATATLPAAIAAFDFTGSIATSLIAWSVPTGINGLVLGAAMAAPRAFRPLAIIAAILAVSVPPLSSITLVSPLPLAGLLFPGAGLAGLALFIALLAVLSILGSNRITSVSAISLVAATAMTAGLMHKRSAVPSDPGIAGVDTHRGQPDARTTALLGGLWRAEERRASDALGSPVLLWPESTYGEWTALTGAMLSSVSATVIGGARTYIDHDRYVNTLVDGKTGQVLYAQRRPVPLVVTERHRAVPAAALKTARRATPDRLYALLCIEIANPWLAIGTFRAARHQAGHAQGAQADSGRRRGLDAGIVVWAANLGWSTRPSLSHRMRATAHQWSRLFDVPVITAINHARVIDA